MTTVAPSKAENGCGQEGRMHRMVTVLTPDESLRTGLPASGNSSARGAGEPVKSALAKRGENEPIDVVSRRVNDAINQILQEAIRKPTSRSTPAVPAKPDTPPEPKADPEPAATAPLSFQVSQVSVHRAQQLRVETGRSARTADHALASPSTCTSSEASPSAFAAAALHTAPSGIPRLQLNLQGTAAARAMTAASFQHPKPFQPDGRGPRRASPVRTSSPGAKFRRRKQQDAAPAAANVIGTVQRKADTGPAVFHRASTYVSKPRVRSPQRVNASLRASRYYPTKSWEQQASSSTTHRKPAFSGGHHLSSSVSNPHSNAQHAPGHSASKTFSSAKPAKSERTVFSRTQAASTSYARPCGPTAAAHPPHRASLYFSSISPDKTTNALSRSFTSPRAGTALTRTLSGGGRKKSPSAPTAPRGRP
ncbi:hypothetical protein DIPPA_34303 [Diplonema papillatum]|nr:hypothetical protein DIPPA_34303 [Diplonema papillatum]